MKLNTAVDNGLVIPKNVTLLMQWDTQVLERCMQVHDLLNKRTHGNHLTAVSSNFNHSLLLGVPFDWSLVGKMKDAC